MRDEYLLLKQAAYLIGVTKQTFEYYIKTGKIKTELNRGNRMVKVSALALFVNEQLKKYDLAKQYFEASSKWAFWKLQPKKFNTTNPIVGDSMIEYLTLQQPAYLLRLSAYNIRYLISSILKSWDQSYVWSNVSGSTAAGKNNMLHGNSS